MTRIFNTLCRGYIKKDVS